ncbi:Major Facilitator Superfamily protein [Rhodoblastus acidophilus]|uniref:Major Facilitator Superfamily protein n=1 Tax=Rhodoblastus acidophilus TaxID=1074 RepID=A0A212RA36_RHOAC|nr:OFA family MFS transporter [Rhodoblastus acidophilus]PPQ39301.1 MFS transporter [Rhodoblastus acidophilus]RAI22374.1 MFS transporter [Rhodoblastus acidophilus]SNB68918.1 Major Facilitator Superfamily protein [Rhodoblastus acidophilus]
MTAQIHAGAPPAPHWLDREATVAKPGFNRWLVPPAALAIHLCIGMAYGFSVFWLPLSQSLGIAKSVACPAGAGLLTALFTTSCDWKVADLGWMYTLFFVLLGSSAALWGGWLERAGPRKAGLVAAFCWAGGLLIGAAGVYWHQLWLLWLGPGVIGGIGLGLGYISPVSTLIKWFPDRRGMATGMAIMGFGGGAMIGSPLAALLMNHFKTPDSVGVWQTFVVLGGVYFLYMLGGALGYRVPPHGWRPEGWTPPATRNRMISSGNVHLRDAHKTPQFWLIWLVLCLNVSAGIGVIGMASPMLQEIFGGALIGKPELGFAALDASQKGAIAVIAAGFAGLLSLFNIAGRFLWASSSDHFGRKATYFIFFGLGIALYAAAPTLAHSGDRALFVLAFGIILSMYGGGFATVPAYLADIFGTAYVGAIHGRLLTAWSTAGIVGPVVVNYIREFNKAAGVPADRLYDATLYILAGFLVVGLICNALVRPVNPKYLMPEDESEKLATAQAIPSGPIGGYGIGGGAFDIKAALAWGAVGVPLAWGVWQTLQKALAIFQ